MDFFPLPFLVLGLSSRYAKRAKGQEQFGRDSCAGRVRERDSRCEGKQRAHTCMCAPPVCTQKPTRFFFLLLLLFFPLPFCACMQRKGTSLSLSHVLFRCTGQLSPFLALLLSQQPRMLALVEQPPRVPAPPSSSFSSYPISSHPRRSLLSMVRLSHLLICSSRLARSLSSTPNDALPFSLSLSDVLPSYLRISLMALLRHPMGLPLSPPSLHPSLSSVSPPHLVYSHGVALSYVCVYACVCAFARYGHCIVRKEIHNIATTQRHTEEEKGTWKYRHRMALLLFWLLIYFAPCACVSVCT